MKTEREILTFHTEKKQEIRDITPDLREILSGSDIKEGMMQVFPHHTSCGVYLSDSDPDLKQDFLEVLEHVAPEEGDYRHNQNDPKENAAAHLKSSLIGHHVVLPITDGSFDFGTYHTVYYAEFDGRRSKEVLVKLFGA